MRMFTVKIPFLTIYYVDDSTEYFTKNA